jgi:hypothetical protein
MKGFSFAAGALTVALVAAPGCDDGAAGVRTVGVASDRDAGQGAFPPGSDAGADATPRDATVVPVDGGAGDPPDVGAGDPPDAGGSAGPDASTSVPSQPDTGAGPDAVVAPVPVPGPDATPPAPARDAAVAPVPAPDAAPPAVCGNGVLEAGEACDDGALRAGCDTHHDGGDGVCRAPGVCSPGFEPGPDGQCRPFEAARGVDIFVDNFCNMEVRPASLHVPPGSALQITWYNRSVDYPVDVWLSYGGGFLDLAPGTQWADRFEFCRGGARPYQAYADISTACSEHRFLIWCD